MVMGAFSSFRLLAVFIVILSYVCPTMSCLESERQALLMLKGGLVDEDNSLDSWVDVGGGDCCDWYGVTCNNSTGHVVSLQIIGRDMHGVISRAIGNLTSLTMLEISGENLQIGGRETIKSIGQLCHLESLSLWGFRMNQDAVDIFHDLFLSCPSNGLEDLYLESCGIFGNLTNVSFEKFKSLVRFSLYNNSISGSIPLSLGELQSLEFVDIKGNLMAGVVSEAHFQKLHKLKTFWAGSNKQLEMEVSPSWIPPFQLTDLSLGSWQLGKQFPQWLRTQKDIESLDLSNCGIEDTIPSWFWNSSLPLETLILSRNNIFGEIPSLAGETFQEGVSIELGSNKLTGQVPIFSSKVYYLDLSNNSFESISEGFWNSTSIHDLVLSHNRIVGEIANNTLKWIDLSSNYFTGKVPTFSSDLVALDLSNNSFFGSISDFLCHEANESKALKILNLGDNLLSGEITNCWTAWKRLIALKLNNNKFIGGLPSSMQNLIFLESLHVRSNSLRGGLPLLLENNSRLAVVDLAENQLEGEIPAWIGESNLTILDLRSNRFHGKIPEEICSLASLRILDFASNNLTGNIPHCISNLQALVTSGKAGNVLEDDNDWNPYQRDVAYVENAIVVMKGRVMEYGNTLKFVRLIDLSSNSLSGDIPTEVTTLVALQSLNLSHNFLTGEIPQEIGSMKEIESLDLSMNKLSGQIPKSIANLTFLGDLDLSSNNLTGAIPLGTQLQGFNASCFADNDLCGPPLAKSCAPITGTATDDPEHDDDHDHVKWFWVTAAFGFVLGFWVVVFPIFYSRRWRFEFFSALDRIWDFLLVIFGRYHRF